MDQLFLISVPVTGMPRNASREGKGLIVFFVDLMLNFSSFSSCFQIRILFTSSLGSCLDLECFALIFDAVESDGLMLNPWSLGVLSLLRNPKTHLHVIALSEPDDVCNFSPL